VHARQALRVAIAIGVLAVIPVVGCFSFGDLSGGDSDAGSIVDASQAVEATNDASVAPHFDAGNEPDGAPITFESCAAAHAAVPNAPDGFFPLSGIDGGAPIQAYCDMTQDNGGWMLVTPEMIVSQTFPGGTRVSSTDENGGLVVKNYPNDDSCGVDAGPDPFDTITFSVDRPWAQIRAQYYFNGLVSCSDVFGSAVLGTAKNTLPFNLAVDLIHDEIKMGGVAPDGGPIDDFDGVVHHCDDNPDNFWQFNTGSQRGAVLALRRDLPGSAGLSTRMTCFTGPTGVNASSWWEYRDIYVR
jgi:hypothetical protein